MERLYLKLREVAEACGVSKRTAWAWVNEGLPTIKVGGTVLVKKADLEAWLDSFQVDRGRVDTIVAEVMAGLK